MVRSRSLRAPALVFAGVILVTVAGCARDGAPESSPTLRQSAAELSSGLFCPGPDVHTKHLNMFACSVCHVEGGTFGFDNPYRFAGGTTTAGGTFDCPTTATPATCTVACHFPKGAPAKSLAWNTPGPLACTECHATTALPPAHPSVSQDATRAQCEVCHQLSNHMEGTVSIVSHGAAWSDPASPQFHAFSANSGLQGCGACHGQDLAGGLSGVACGRCHDVNLPAGVASWKVNCVMCHGGTDNPTGAPPKATWGNTAEVVRVGAHTAHVTAGPLAQAIPCVACHAVPADALAAGHLDGGTAEVTFGGIAAAGTPTWNREVATCAVYCHGATLAAGGSHTAPSWLGGPTEVACGTCHGSPPPSPHPQNTSCYRCHPGTARVDGTIDVAGGQHVDGTVQTSLGCTSCHGTEGVNPAPPIGTRGETLTTQRAVGAHQKHVVTGAIRIAFACSDCHAPVSDLTHVNGTVSLPFAGLASLGTTPSWTGASCASTYCHGATLGAGGSNTTPTWTAVSAGTTSCGSCHGAPPPFPHPQNPSCNLCHAGTVLASGAIDVVGGQHIDGTVQATGGHDATWMDTTSADFHAYSANAGISGCQGCHGANLDGVGAFASTSCATCHGSTWRTNCLMCHGGVANTTGAPPSGTWGHETDPLRIGAHTAHVTTTTTKVAYDCSACHLKPSDALAAGHMDGSVTTVTWGALARAGGASPSWDRASGTCASTYCHGNYSGTYRYTVWDWGSDSPIEMSVPYGGTPREPASWTGSGTTCTACHGSPPNSYYWHVGHGGGTSCSLCHPDANAAGTAVTNPSLHVNGIIDVAPRWTSSCYGCH